MPFHVRDQEATALIRELAQRRGVGITEAVKLAARAALQEDMGADRRRRVRDLQDRVAALPRSGLVADKAFFDDLSGQGDD